MVPTLLWLLALGAAQAITVDVCDAGCDFTTLAEALADPRVDTILLADQAYDERIVAEGRSLTVVGSGGTLLTCAGSGGATITLESGSLAVVDAEVQPCADGRAIDVKGSARLWFEGGRLKSEGSSFDLRGRGIHAPGAARITLLNTELRGLNAGSADGGGVFLGSGASLTVMGTRFASNEARTGGAVYSDGGTVMVEGGLFDGNIATTGGGIAAVGGTVDVWGTDFLNGTGGSAYLYMDDVDLRVMEGTDFRGGVSTQVRLIDGVSVFQDASFDGAKIHVHYDHDDVGSHLVLGRSQFMNATAGSLLLRGADDGRVHVEVRYNHFQNNAGQTAGALDVNGVRIVVEGNTFSNNRSSCCRSINAGVMSFGGTVYNQLVQYNLFCDNRGTNNTTGDVFRWDKGGGTVFRNVFYGHSGITSLNQLDGTVNFQNNTFVASGTVADLYIRATSVFENNVVLRQSTGVGATSSGGSYSKKGYNAYSSNVSPFYGFAGNAATDFTVASPSFLTADASLACTADYRPNAGSPLRDAGDPAKNDRDGSRLDVGARPYQDGDDDGSVEGPDCDDTARDRTPGGTEICDGVDNDCDGDVDEDPEDGRLWFLDDDADGFGNAGTGARSCARLETRVLNDDDCDDADDRVNPLAGEICSDGIDNNCNGDIDEPPNPGVFYFPDADSDGFGDQDAVGVDGCDFELGMVTNDGDCNDDDDSVAPTLGEQCDGKDNDCDGNIDSPDPAGASDHYADVDGDDHGDPTSLISSCQVPDDRVTVAGDCDDTDGAVSPDAPERCGDGIDNNCDGTADEPEADDAQRWYYDGDGDEHGDAAISQLSCAKPDRYVLADDDCRDDKPTVFPGADELCDGLDNDCDLDVDEEPVEGALTYADSDTDGFGDPDSAALFCTTPADRVTDDGDCDDSNPAVNPAATEACNGYDDDCDGQIDGPEAEGTTTFYVDSDGDDFGDLSQPVQRCSDADGVAADAGDCDDGAAAVNPGASEQCSGRDDDCDGEIDEDDAEDAPDWYRDDDGDGSGVSGDAVQACVAPEGRSSAGGDCDDSDELVSPTSPERCSPADDDCDGQVDEAGAIGETRWFSDGDGDGYGAPGTGEESCEARSGEVANDEDCRDSDPLAYPGAPERCNGLDDSCDGVVDGGLRVDLRYTDGDGDGYGAPGTGEESCDDGRVLAGGDCDDGDSDVNPGSTEVWYDGVDQDCDGNDADQDSDGFLAEAAGGEDCDDQNASVFPGALDGPNGDTRDCLQRGTMVFVSGGCSSAPSGPLPGLPVVLLLALSRGVRPREVRGR